MPSLFSQSFRRLAVTSTFRYQESGRYDDEYASLAAEHHNHSACVCECEAPTAPYAPYSQAGHWARHVSAAKERKRTGDLSSALQFQNMGILTPEEEKAYKAISHHDPDARPKWQLLHTVAVRKGLKHYVDPVTGDLVMTELALKELGECCGNLCRHCPWGNVGSGAGPA